MLCGVGDFFLGVVEIRWGAVMKVSDAVGVGVDVGAI